MKYIDLDGLSYFWAQVKAHVASAVEVAKTSVGNYTINGKKISSNPTLTKTDVGLGNVTNDAQVKRSEMGVANGVATLGTDNKLPTAQLPAMKTVNGQSVLGSGNIAIDLSLYKVVESLPTTGIDANKIYLVLSGTSGTQNKYTEYIYANNAWEKIGEYKADVDLTPYVKFTDLATAQKAGAMSAQDKKNLDDIKKWASYSNPDNTSLLSVAENATGVSLGFKGLNDSFDEVDIATATTSTAGVMSPTDKTRLDGIFAGNLPLVDVAISIFNWKIFKNDGTTQDSTNNTSKALTLEIGYKAQFTGAYKWTAAAGKKNPTIIDSTSSWKTLTASGVESDAFTSSVTGTNATYKVKLGAPKTGLMVSGADVKPASGNDYKEASASVTFKYRLFTGMATTQNVTEDIVKALTGELVTSPNTTKSGITATATQYYVMAYPSSLGNLTQIIQDGATPVLGAFTKNTLSVTNGAGYTQTYNVYVSNNPGAFTNASLQFVK